MAYTKAAKQEIWLKELMAEIMNKEDKKVVLKINNKSAITLTKNVSLKKQIHTLEVPLHSRMCGVRLNQS